MDATWSPLINNVTVFPFMCDLVILEISNMPEATSGCSAALAAAKYYCMKNAAAAGEEEDTPASPASPFLFQDPSCWQEMHLSSAELVEPSLGFLNFNNDIVQARYIHLKLEKGFLLSKLSIRLVEIL